MKHSELAASAQSFPLTIGAMTAHSLTESAPRDPARLEERAGTAPFALS